MAEDFRVQPPIRSSRSRTPKLCLLLVLAVLTGCPSRPPANVRHVSLGIFEVIDCKAGMAPMTLKGGTEKYCLAVKPMVDETDVRGALASRGGSGEPQLQLYFTLKTGQYVRETTERIQAEHLRRHDQGKVGIVIDGALISVPVLNGVISDSLMIEGGFSWEDAVQIAGSLNAPSQRPSSSNGQN